LTSLFSEKVALILALSLFWLNLGDLVVTMFWTQSGIGTESNPLMSALIAVNIWYFVVVKFTLGTVACVVCVMFYHKLYAQIALIVSVLAYLSVLAIHGRVAYLFISAI